MVEDHAGSRDSLARLLTLVGASVLMAADGQQALEILATDDPDVVLCDLQMPRMDGFELIGRLQADARCAHWRVIAITGLSDPEDHVRTSRAGFEHHISKPLDFDALVQLLARGRRRR